MADTKVPTEHSDSNADARYWANVAKYVVGAGFILWMMSSQWSATKQTVQTTSGGQTFAFIALAALVAFGAPRAPKGTGTFLALLAGAYLYQTGMASGALEVLRDFVAPAAPPAVQQPSAPPAPRVMPPTHGRMYMAKPEAHEPAHYHVCRLEKSASGSIAFEQWIKRNDETVDMIAHYGAPSADGVGIGRCPVRNHIDLRESPQFEWMIEEGLTTKFLDGQHRKVHKCRRWLRQNTKVVQIFYLELNK